MVPWPAALSQSLFQTHPPGDGDPSWPQSAVLLLLHSPVAQGTDPALPDAAVGCRVATSQLALPCSQTTASTSFHLTFSFTSAPTGPSAAFILLGLFFLTAAIGAAQAAAAAMWRPVAPSHIRMCKLLFMI